MSVLLNGVAHIQLTVNDPARCMPFWEKLCHFFEMQTLIKNENTLYCIGSRTGILVRGETAGRNRGPFDQRRAGLHHFCLRARSREDVDTVAGFAEEIGAKIVHPAEEGSQFAPGYYSVLFEDPDGIRVEVNYVPGKGHFGVGGRLGPGGEGPATEYGEDGLRGSKNGPNTNDPILTTDECAAAINRSVAIAGIQIGLMYLSWTARAGRPFLLPYLMNDNEEGRAGGPISSTTFNFESITR